MSVFKHDHLITLGRPHPRGGRYLTSSRDERKSLRIAIKKGIASLKRVGNFKDARICEHALGREWQQVRPPFQAYVTHDEWKALSRALRADALAAVGEDRETKMQGIGNRAYWLLCNRREY